MFLQDYLNSAQINLCEENGIQIKNKDYNYEEIYTIEHQIEELINKKCTDEKFYLIEEQFDEIIDILMDLENESDELNTTSVEFEENDHVELNNGKLGVIVDITNNVYTIEVDEDFKTGNIDEDIMIVASNSILKRI